MITDTYKWCTSRRYSIPNTVNFSGINLKTGAAVNISNKLPSYESYLNIDGSFDTTYGRGYNPNTQDPGSRYLCVALGTGTTQPSASDRDMEAYVADFAYVTQGWGTINQADAIGTYDECIVTYRYTGSSEVTISEVGIYMRVEPDYSSTSNRITALMEHSLLSMPKVMNTNDTITLSVKLYHTGAIALS